MKHFFSGKFLLLALPFTLLLCSCSDSDEDLAAQRVRRDQLYATYANDSVDRVVDSYGGRFRIEVPAGTKTYVNDSMSVKFIAQSPDGRNTVYIWAANADDVKKGDSFSGDSGQEYEWNSSAIEKMDKKVFRLGEMLDEESSWFNLHPTVRHYAFNDSTMAITKTYYGSKHSYVLCAYYPKDDSSYVDQMIDSFDPTRTNSPSNWAFVVMAVLVAIMVLVYFISEPLADALYIYPIVGWFIYFFYVLWSPVFVDYHRDYILFNTFIKDLLMSLECFG